MKRKILITSTIIGILSISFLTSCNCYINKTENTCTNNGCQLCGFVCYEPNEYACTWYPLACGFYDTQYDTFICDYTYTGNGLALVLFGCDVCHGTCYDKNDEYDTKTEGSYEIKNLTNKDFVVSPTIGVSNEYGNLTTAHVVNGVLSFDNYDYNELAQTSNIKLTLALSSPNYNLTDFIVSYDVNYGNQTFTKEASLKSIYGLEKGNHYLTIDIPTSYNSSLFNGVSNFKFEAKARVWEEKK